MARVRMAGMTRQIRSMIREGLEAADQCGVQSYSLSTSLSMMEGMSRVAVDYVRSGKRAEGSKGLLKLWERQIGSMPLCFYTLQETVTGARPILAWKYSTERSKLHHHSTSCASSPS
jgi:hypothetical protein